MNTIITIILAIIGSGLLNVVISNLFYNSKLRKENSHKAAYKHAQEIEESIQAFRELELKLNEIEIYDIENQLKQNPNINMFGGNAIYPAILNDVYSLNEYRLVGHSYPGEEEPEPSLEDRVFLKEFGQSKSCVISARTGRITEFTSNPFDI